MSDSLFGFTSSFIVPTVVSIAVGTTPITSGTVGRVLFEGTGNVVQESANLFWDNTSGFFGINTSAPTVALDVVTNSIGSPFQLRNLNTTGVVAVNLFNAGGTNVGGFGYAGSTYSGTSLQDKLYFYTPKDFIITPNGTTNYFRVFTATGNIGINTTTDAGYKLDVNGTTRVSGQLEVLSNTSSNGILLKHTASATTASQIYYASSDAMTYFDNLFNPTGSLGLGGFILRTKDNTNTLTRRISVDGLNGNVGLGITGSASTRLQIVSGNDSVPTLGSFAGKLSLLNGGGNGSYGMLFGVLGSGNSYIQVQRIDGTATSYPLTLQPSGGNVLINTTTDIASSKLTIESTTQGFLPPRMTTAQINAIVSPAEGLQVYNTTISHMCVYQAGAWAKLSHSPM